MPVPRALKLSINMLQTCPDTMVSDYRDGICGALSSKYGSDFLLLLPSQLKKYAYVTFVKNANALGKGPEILAPSWDQRFL